MNLQFDKTWLRARISAEPDMDCEIGIESEQIQEVIEEGTRASGANILGAVVVQIRRP